jgi:putative DNA primase/helicase
MTIADFLAKLDGAKPQGSGWIARCPAHQDRSPSLSVTEGDQGRILLTCHAGCATESVCAALGLRVNDLFAEPPQKASNPRYEFERAYDYRDESGALLFQAVRQRLSNPRECPAAKLKNFAQRKPDGRGGWDYKLNGTRRVLYALPELLQSHRQATVFISEGEKDADRLRALGLVATTNPQGAGKWRADYAESLRGRDVVILPDNDQPGRAHAQTVARSLQGVAASIKVLELPGLPEKGDVSDWLDAGGQVETLCAMVDDLPEWMPGVPPAATPAAAPLLRVVRMADVKAEKVEWLWPNRIAQRAITIIEGIEGVGKSTLLCAVASAITHGKGLPETEPGEPGNVVWLSAEDDLASVLKPRLEATGADCERIFAVPDPFTLDEQGLLGLREAIAERQPKLVIIDPIFAYTRGDANKGNDARALTGELKKIADQFACAVCLVRHVGKSKGLGDPRAAGLYSIEWRAAARSVLLVGADPDDPNKRAITNTKNNLGPKAESLGYVIQSDSSSPSGARFYWTGNSDLTAERILEAVGQAEETAQESNGRDDAEDFLRTVLGDGPRLATDVEKEAKEAKISFATLRRAKDNLGVKSRKFGGKFGGDAKWYWTLPEDAQAEDAHPSLKMLTYTEGEHLQANRGNNGSYSNGLTEDAHLPISERLQAASEHLQQRDRVMEAIER